MLQEIAKGYIQREKKLKKNIHIEEKVARFKGKLKVDKKSITVEVFSNDSNLQDKEIFIKLSNEVADNVYGML